jgi:hypothetical protein
MPEIERIVADIRRRDAQGARIPGLQWPPPGR